MKRESTARWVANGLPRKEWKIDWVEELERGNETNCDWCGTEIRFVYHLKHPEAVQRTISGCVCAGALTNDYKNAEETKKRYYADRAVEKKAARMLWTDQKKAEREAAKREAGSVRLRELERKLERK